MRKPGKDTIATLIYLVIGVSSLCLLIGVINGDPRVPAPAEYDLSSLWEVESNLVSDAAAPLPAVVSQPSDSSEEAASSDTEPPPGEASSNTEVSALINLNTASAEELCTLYGIGPVLAQRIIDYREMANGFGSIEEIMEVSGIAEKRFAAIRDYITVE